MYPTACGPTEEGHVQTAAFADEITVEQLDLDPYPIYARLRREAPVCRIPAVDTWMVTRWDDVEFLGAHPEIFSADIADSPVDRTFGSPTVLTCDGEVHTELRRAIDPKFRPRAVDEYVDGLVGPIVDELLERIAPRGEAELMAEFFEPVSVRSLGAVLGLSEIDPDTLRRWFAQLAQGATNYERDPGKQAVGDAAAAEIDERLAPLLHRLERASDGSAIAHMLHAGMPPGRTRARDLVMPSLKVILLGGMQEPGHGAGSTTWALLREPEQALALGERPGELVRQAVDEGLRLIAPIGTQFREVKQPVTVAGVELEPGAPVSLVIASANRDERRFEQPDRYDMFRGKRQHAAFGFGRHFCSGHWFSRRQMEIAVGALFGRLAGRGLRLDPARPAELRGWEFRAPRHLHVRWDAP
jgi:cytochrome P450